MIDNDDCGGGGGGGGGGDSESVGNDGDCDDNVCFVGSGGSENDDNVAQVNSDMFPSKRTEYLVLFSFACCFHVYFIA